MGPDTPWLVWSIITVAVSGISSGGLWAFLDKKSTRTNASTQLLLGLAHDRIIYLGRHYIDRGYITLDEYEDFIRYLWEPYSKFGGNGLADRVMREVSLLPFAEKTNKETI